MKWSEVYEIWCTYMRSWVIKSVVHIAIEKGYLIPILKEKRVGVCVNEKWREIPARMVPIKSIAARRGESPSSKFTTWRMGEVGWNQRKTHKIVEIVRIRKRIWSCTWPWMTWDLASRVDASGVDGWKGVSVGSLRVRRRLSREGVDPGKKNSSMNKVGTCNHKVTMK